MPEPISAKVRNTGNADPCAAKDGASKGDTSATTVTQAPARTVLGRRLREIRHRYIAAGSQLLSVEDIDREIAGRRRERYPEYYARLPRRRT